MPEHEHSDRQPRNCHVQHGPRVRAAAQEAYIRVIVTELKHAEPPSWIPLVLSKRRLYLGWRARRLEGAPEDQQGQMANGAVGKVSASGQCMRHDLGPHRRQFKLWGLPQRQTSRSCC